MFRRWGQVRCMNRKRGPKIEKKNKAARGERENMKENSGFRGRVASGKKADPEQESPADRERLGGGLASATEKEHFPPC